MAILQSGSSDVELWGEPNMTMLGPRPTPRSTTAITKDGAIEPYLT
jgi:hypothetical protein